jgi:hypothetical protein
MRLLIIVAGFVLVLGGPVVAKELKVTNSADFVNCAAGIALTAGPRMPAKSRSREIRASFSRGYML